MEDEFGNVIYRFIEDAFYDLKKKEDMDIEKICRNYLSPPIKGAITRGKLKWRGATSLAYSPNHDLLGVIQRGYVIDINGNKTPTETAYSLGRAL